MTELEILQKQVDALKELVKIQEKTIEVLKTQPVTYQPVVIPNIQPNIPGSTNPWVSYTFTNGQASITSDLTSNIGGLQYVQEQNRNRC